MNPDNTDENVGWPSYVDFLSTFIFLLILFIGSLVFQVSGVMAQQKMKRDVGRVASEIKVPNYIRQNKIFIPLADQVKFESNSAVLNDDAQKRLRAVGQQIARACSDPQVYCKRVVVEGHADRVPVKNDPRFGNWKLSANRALNVLEFFYGCNDCGYGEQIRSRLTLSGEGDIGATRSFAGSSEDRRVDVILEFGQVGHE